MYMGIYQSSNKHKPDLDKVIERSIENGLDKVIISHNQYCVIDHHIQIVFFIWPICNSQIFITSGCIADFDRSIKLIDSYKDKEKFFYTTIGCHPTRCLEFTEAEDDGESYLNKLEELYLKFKEKIIAFGELGLDFDRLMFCPKDVQIKYFEKQLELLKKTKLPMFLHCRNAEDDFKAIIKKHNHELYGGVVCWILIDNLIS